MLSLNFSPFPVLQTGRLLLRELVLTDAPALRVMRGDAEVMKYIGRPLTQTVEEAEAWIHMVIDALAKNEGITWAICLKTAPDEMLGTIGLWRFEKDHYRGEIGYMLQPAFQGKGLTTEAIREVVRFGFDELKLHSIEGKLDPRNEASAAVLKKCGFVQEAHFRENYCLRGEFVDSAVYSILNPSDKKFTQSSGIPFSTAERLN